MGKFQKNVPNFVKQKNPKNKRNKTAIIFDEKARVEYLTGFRKRKNERRKVAQEKIIEDLKEEKRKLKLKKREDLNEKWKNLDLQSNLDSFTSGTTYDLPKHTVTVDDISSTDFVGSTGYHLGTNQFKDLDEPESKNQSNQSSDDETDQEKSGSTDQKLDSAKNKKKKKFHKNLTHLMSKQSLAKKNKATKKMQAQAGPTERIRMNTLKKKKQKQRRNKPK